MEYRDKFVDFGKYCKTCEYRDLDEWLDPCNECLDNPVNEHSKKPINYEEDEKKVKEENKKENE